MHKKYGWPIQNIPALLRNIGEHHPKLLQWVGRYGCPSTNLSVNGTHYVNQIIDEFIYLMGSEHDLKMAYSKEENAILERENKV
jgi:hypothetical protein